MRPFSQSQALIAESVLLDSRLALFHERENWLAIADLHFGFELSQRAWPGVSCRFGEWNRLKPD
jgi:metallophosphoesterase superfamily enzyme